MYSLSSTTPCEPSLQHHLVSAKTKSIRFNDKVGAYEYRVAGSMRTVPGLLSCLRRVYYPKQTKRDYKRSHGKRRLKKGSSMKQGSLVDAQLDEYLRTNKYPTHRWALALLDYWEQNGHELHATQIPVHVDRFKCITQADCITIDAKGRLTMWEIKTGAPRRASSSKKRLRGKLRGVTNSIANQWELQRHFTATALEANQVKLRASYVLNVYDQYNRDTKKTTVQVRKRPVPKWAREQLPR